MRSTTDLIVIFSAKFIVNSYLNVLWNILINISDPSAEGNPPVSCQGGVIAAKIRVRVGEARRHKGSPLCCKQIRGLYAKCVGVTGANRIRCDLPQQLDPAASQCDRVGGKSKSTTGVATMSKKEKEKKGTGAS